MLKIRDEQIEVFKEEARRRFTERTFRHLRHYLPEKIDAFGDEATRTIIQEGIDCAKTYSIAIERPSLTLLERADAGSLGVYDGELCNPYVEAFAETICKQDGEHVSDFGD